MARSSVTIRYTFDAQTGEECAVTACAGTSDLVTLDALEATVTKAFYKTVASVMELTDRREAKETQE